MMKKTHLALGAAANFAAHGLEPLSMGAALFGSMLPDFDLLLKIPHRTITHWVIWPALVWALPLGLVGDGLAIGWLAHIAADCLTVGGLAPLWPLPVRLRGPIKTGAASEYIFVGGLAALIGVWLW